MYHISLGSPGVLTRLSQLRVADRDYWYRRETKYDGVFLFPGWGLIPELTISRRSECCVSGGARYPVGLAATVCWPFNSRGGDLRDSLGQTWSSVWPNTRAFQKPIPHHSELIADFFCGVKAGSGLHCSPGSLLSSRGKLFSRGSDSSISWGLATSGQNALARNLRR